MVIGTNKRGDYYEDIDTIFIDPQTGEIVLKREIFSRYEYLVIARGIFPHTDMLRMFLEKLKDNDIVYGTEEEIKTAKGKIAKGFLSWILSLLGPNKIYEDGILTWIVATRTSILNGDEIKIYSPLIMPSILIYIDREIKARSINIPDVNSNEELKTWPIIKSTMKIGLRTGQIYRMIKFLLIGLLAIFISEFSLWYITEFFGVRYYISALIACQITNIVAFILNEFIVFRGRVKYSVAAVLSRFLKYAITYWITSFAGWLTLIFFTEIVGIHYLIANLFGIIVGSILIFLASFEKIWK